MAVKIITENSAKAEIEKQAVRLIATKGYANTTVREIVEAAGVSKPTLYYYFRNKADLYEKVFKQHMDHFLGQMEIISTLDASMIERLENVAELHFSTLRGDPLLARFFFRAIFGGSSQMPEFDFNPIIEREDFYIESILSDGVRRSEFPREAAGSFAVTQFKGAIHIYVTRLAICMEAEMPDDLAQQIVSFFLHGILGKCDSKEHSSENKVSHS